MAMFVHLAAESCLARIRRNGVNRLRNPWGETPGGVFAVPVTRDFHATHQWLRELKRRGQGAVAGVYFRIPDDETVWVGRYARAHRPMTAAEASAEFSSAESCAGWQVVVPRRIGAKEIHRVRSLPQVVGWRYFPEAKGKPPFCTCKYCTRGEYGAARMRARLGSPDA